MRRIFLSIVICFPLLIKAQDSLVVGKKGEDTLFTKSGFIITVGQEIKIGVGSMPDGDFKYIRRNATSVFAYNSRSGYQGLANQANAFPRAGSGLKYKVLKIDKRGDKKHGYVYYPILKGYVRYEIDIDNAIDAGEIVVPDEFKPKPKTVFAEKENISVADELLKLKKLRDDSIITEDEFQSQKKKLLGEK